MDGPEVSELRPCEAPPAYLVHRRNRLVHVEVHGRGEGENDDSLSLPHERVARAERVAGEDEPLGSIDDADMMSGVPEGVDELELVPAQPQHLSVGDLQRGGSGDERRETPAVRTVVIVERGRIATGPRQFLDRLEQRGILDGEPRLGRVEAAD